MYKAAPTQLQQRQRTGRVPKPSLFEGQDNRWITWLQLYYSLFAMSNNALHIVCPKAQLWSFIKSDCFIIRNVLLCQLTTQRAMQSACTTLVRLGCSGRQRLYILWHKSRHLQHYVLLHKAYLGGTHGHPNNDEISGTRTNPMLNVVEGMQSLFRSYKFTMGCTAPR